MISYPRLVRCEPVDMDLHNRIIDNNLAVPPDDRPHIVSDRKDWVVS